MNAGLKGTHPGGCIGKKGKRVAEREDSLKENGKRCEKENGKGVKQKTGNDKTVGTHGERVRNACEKDK